MREEPLADLAAGEPRLPVLGRAAQDAEDVELRRAEAVLFEQFGRVMAEAEGEALKVEVEFMLEARVLRGRFKRNRRRACPPF